MYQSEMEQRPAASCRSSSVVLDARDVETLSSLMRELRELTLSHRSFTAASEMLRRFGETDGPRLVPADALG